MKSVIALIGMSFLSFSAQAIEVSEVDCLEVIEGTAQQFTNDELDQLSQKCYKEADELFSRAQKKQDKDLLVQSTTARKSADIAQALRRNNIKNKDNKKAEELRNVQKNRSQSSEVKKAMDQFEKARSLESNADIKKIASQKLADDKVVDQTERVEREQTVEEQVLEDERANEDEEFLAE